MVPVQYRPIDTGPLLLRNIGVIFPFISLCEREIISYILQMCPGKRAYLELPIICFDCKLAVQLCSV